MKSDENKTLFEFVDYELLLRGLTLREGSILMGLSPGALYGIKDRRPRRKTLRKISLFLGCSILDLVNKPVTHEDADKK